MKCSRSGWGVVGRWEVRKCRCKASQIRTVVGIARRLVSLPITPCHMSHVTHCVLHHLCSPCPHPLHILEYVGSLSLLQLIHHGVNGHVGPCAACSSTTCVNEEVVSLVRGWEMKWHATPDCIQVYGDMYCKYIVIRIHSSVF